MLSKVVWATPALKDHFVIESISKLESNSLVVIGTEDPFYSVDAIKELEIKIKTNTTTGEELEYLDIVSITLHGQNVFELGFTPDTVRRIITESENYADDLWEKRFDK